ncbi:MAG: DNA primase [Deltaproteobacteria bacterium]|nr:DNA primase [Deltaproteobacteria bacterium]
MSSFIPDETITRVRETTDIVGVVSQFVTLKRKSGKNLLGLCPFHNEKTPSFTVHPEKQIFHCFGCGEGGNIYTFLMKIENKSFPEVVRDLAARAGIEIPGEQRGTQDPQAALRDRIHEVNFQASNYFHAILTKSQTGAAGMEYIGRREVGREMIDKHHLGFAPGSGKALRNALAKRGYDDALLETAGLVTRLEGGGTLDRFRNRVIFPIYAPAGNVAGFGGRTIESSADTPKYLNSPETAAYNKSVLLYGLSKAKDAVRKERARPLILVEGYLDMVMLDQAGFAATVATCGTALTPQHAASIRRYTRRLCLCFDGDEAGRKAVLRAAEVLIPTDLEVTVVALPPEEDPDLFIRRYGPDAFEARVSGALPLLEFIFEHFASRSGDSVEGRSAAFAAIAGYVARTPDEITRTMYTQKLAERFSIDERLAIGRVSRAARRKEGGKTAEEAASRELRGIPRAELLLAAAALREPRLLEDSDVEEITSKMTDAELASLVRTVVHRGLAGDPVLPSAALDMIQGAGLRAALSGLAVDDAGVAEGRGARMVEDCALRIRRDWIASSLRLIDAEIRQCQSRGETSGLDTLLKRKMDLAREMKTSGRDAPAPNSRRGE